MVDLEEHEGKLLFKEYGIKVPESRLIKSGRDIRELHGNYVIKAQVPTGHRGTSGGVVKVSTKKQAMSAIEKIKKLDFNGFRAEKFLLEKFTEHTKEFYLSLVLDRGERSVMLIASRKGGVDIERVDKAYIKKIDIDIFIGVPDYRKRELSKFLGLDGELQPQFSSMLDSMWRLYRKEDAELVEINPLALSKEGLVALDSKIIIEDDALFRHDKYLRFRNPADPIESKAEKIGVTFVRLDGKVGVIANGAGLNLATIDQIKLKGGEAADFLDLSGTDDPEKVSQAVELVMETGPRVILINIFGGVTKADTVATGISEAIIKLKPKCPILVRLRGFNEEEGIRILKKNNIRTFEGMDEAIEEAVKLARE